MDIAIIGAGNVGRALSTSGVRAGHSVTIAAADPENAAALADETRARSARSNREAVESVEAVILAVPTSAIDDVLSDVGDHLAGKILIDVTNRVNAEDPGAVLDGTSNAERIQSQVPEARVVKAFNTAFAARQADPVVDGIPVDMFVAGDSDEARAAVLDLAASIGFRPIDAGPLAMARSLEAMGLLIITLQIRHGWSWQNGWKLIGPT